MVLIIVPEVTFTRAVLIAVVVLAEAAILTIKLLEPAIGVTVNQVGIVVELAVPVNIIVQFALELIAKVSVQALLDGNKIFVLERLR